MQVHRDFVNMDEYFFCPECRKIYKSHRCLRIHVRKFHSEKLSELAPGLRERKKFNFKCEHCPQRFNRLPNLKYHLRQKHNIGVKEKIEKKFTCSECSKAYMYVKTLKLHVSKFHPSNSGDITSKEQSVCMHHCPLCDVSSTKAELLDHFNSKHGINVEVENLEFSTFVEFLDWKSDMEKRTKSRFFKLRGTQKSKATMAHYFKCHRSGSFISKSKGYRTLKRQGSNKLNGFCPAGIITHVAEDGKCTVKFTKTHIGHDNDMKHLFLSAEERQIIAEKIASNLPFDKILDEIRETITGDNVERLHLLTKKDLHNIRKCSLRNEIDQTDEDWVSKFQMNENSSILVYKPQGKTLEKYPQLNINDFILIIMSDLQQEILNKYGNDYVCLDATSVFNTEDYFLVTLLVVDDTKQSIPCAFLISNREDDEILPIFFMEIKYRVGTVSPKIFISDTVDEFYNIWVQIMDRPKCRIYSDWCVDQAWQESLQKINTVEKRQVVYENLKILKKERNVKKFQTIMQEFTSKINDDSDLVAFSVYFVSNFLNCAPFWAFCYRLYDNIDIESIHRTVKFLYSNLRQAKSFYKFICELARFTIPNIVHKFENKDDLLSKLKSLRYRHKRSVMLSLEFIHKQKNGWIVPSLLSSGEKYFVQKISEVCCCQCLCIECNSCTHQYSCTCEDSKTRQNMCEHIHLICQLQNSVSSDISDNQYELSMNGYLFMKPRIQSLNERKEKIRKRFNEIIDTVSFERQVEVLERIHEAIPTTLETICTADKDCGLSIKLSV